MGFCGYGGIIVRQLYTLPQLMGMLTVNIGLLIGNTDMFDLESRVCLEISAIGASNMVWLHARTSAAVWTIIQSRI